MVQRIASRENEKIKYAKRIAASGAFRAQEGLFLAEGRRLCFDLASTAQPRAAFFTEKMQRACPEVAQLAQENYSISDPVDDKLAETKNPQGLYCLFALPKATLADLPLGGGLLLCEQLQDPSNVGAVLRSAAAFGFGGVVLAGCADPFAPKALRASMGAVLRLPVVLSAEATEPMEVLQAKGVRVYAAALEGGVPLGSAQPQGAFALLVGNEGAGLSAEALALANERVYIPMHHGVESLNAAVAASVLMFHFAAAGGRQDA